MKPSLKVLTDLKWQHDCLNTKMRPDYVPKKKYTDITANGLTTCIVDWINLNGYQAERISTTGRYIDNTKIVTDILGNRKKIGSGKYIKSSGAVGSADISATIKGKSIKIEVKIGSDRQSEAQKNYEYNITKAGGVYFIAKDFDSFILFYKKIIDC
jgi:hypothetical protein